MAAGSKCFIPCHNPDWSGIFVKAAHSIVSAYDKKERKKSKVVKKELAEDANLTGLAYKIIPAPEFGKGYVPEVTVNPSPARKKMLTFREFMRQSFARYSDYFLGGKRLTLKTKIRIWRELKREVTFRKNLFEANVELGSIDKDDIDALTKFINSNAATEKEKNRNKKRVTGEDECNETTNFNEPPPSKDLDWEDDIFDGSQNYPGDIFCCSDILKDMIEFSKKVGVNHEKGACPGECKENKKAGKEIKADNCEVVLPAVAYPPKKSGCRMTRREKKVGKENEVKLNKDYLVDKVVSEEKTFSAGSVTNKLGVVSKLKDCCGKLVGPKYIVSMCGEKKNGDGGKKNSPQGDKKRFVNLIEVTDVNGKVYQLAINNAAPVQKPVDPQSDHFKLSCVIRKTFEMNFSHPKGDKKRKNKNYNRSPRGQYYGQY
uniref:DUF4776 domain-containing protein n=1 Tax=Rhabditophanes sp. KR3021 TaxID=114890 RepID=A0AC35UD57_9BILA